MDTTLLTSEGERLLTGSDAVYSRIKEKMNDFKRYDFSRDQACALNIFFDLAQEFGSTAKLHTLAVLVPHIFFGVDSQLFILESAQHNQDEPDKPKLELKASSMAKGGLAPDELVKLLHGPPCWYKGFFCCPVIGRVCHEHDETLDNEPEPGCNPEEPLGIFALRPETKFDAHQELYFTKYTNRMGVQIHNRILATRNRMHIRFVKGLVNDIGHNVIVPNMYFKLLIQQLYSRIESISNLKLDVESGNLDSKAVSLRLEVLQHRLQEQYTEIYRHFQQTSLFLESLLRQSHFDQGRYVLQQTKVDLMQRVVMPQIDRFLGRMRDRGIMPCMPDTPANIAKDKTIMVMADVGLISQVLANLLSNAVKYTRPDKTTGKSFVSCRVEVLADYFGCKKDGVKVAVVSTGEHIKEDESTHLYEAQFRASNTKGEYGTGHGLHFVHEMVMQHHGEVGYAPVPEGNSFYFILPCEGVSIPSL